MGQQHAGITPALAAPSPSIQDGPKRGRHERGHGIVLTIGLYKFGKALFMLAVGITALRLIHHNVVEIVAHWVTRLHLDPENRGFIHALESRIMPNLAQLNDARLRLAGIMALAYMVLYSVEGIGLIRERRWAEWLTVISGMGLMPIEIYALCHRPNVIKALLLASNVAISAYLYVHVRRKTSRMPGY